MNQTLFDKHFPDSAIECNTRYEMANGMRMFVVELSWNDGLNALETWLYPAQTNEHGFVMGCLRLIAEINLVEKGVKS